MRCRCRRCNVRFTTSSTISVAGRDHRRSSKLPWQEGLRGHDCVILHWYGSCHTREWTPTTPWPPGKEPSLNSPAPALPTRPSPWRWTMPRLPLSSTGCRLAAGASRSGRAPAIGPGIVSCPPTSPGPWVFSGARSWSASMPEAISGSRLPTGVAACPPRSSWGRRSNGVVASCHRAWWWSVIRRPVWPPTWPPIRKQY